MFKVKGQKSRSRGQR